MRVSILLIVPALIGVCLASIEEHIEVFEDLPEVDFVDDPLTGRGKNISPERKLRAQLKVLEALGKPIPEEHSETASRFGIVASPEKTRLQTTHRQNSVSKMFSGTKSTFIITHEGVTSPTTEEQAAYEKAQVAFNAAVEAWSNVFPSSEPVRILSKWVDLGDPDLLGSAGTTSIRIGDTCRNSYSGPGVKYAMYPAAVLNALLGRNVGSLEYHVQMTMNSAFTSWFFDYPNPIVTGQSDLMSVALHEVCHGLYMSSRARSIDVTAQKALFSSTSSTWTSGGSSIREYRRTPGRFDNFVTDNAKIPLTRYCSDPSTFFKRLVADETGVSSGDSSLRFYDPDATEITDFHLNTPSSYQPGSSTSHFHENPGFPNTGTLLADCAAAGIVPPLLCSELMTPSLTSGTMTREIGENDIRVMNSILSDRPGFIAEKCFADPWDSSI